jgi:hypothetical protein
MTVRVKREEKTAMAVTLAKGRPTASPTFGKVIVEFILLFIALVNLVFPRSASFCSGRRC